MWALGQGHFKPIFRQFFFDVCNEIWRVVSLFIEDKNLLIEPAIHRNSHMT